MRLHLGGWEPGRTNALLLLLQVGFTVQAASRGMDYVLPSPPQPTPRVLTEIEAALPLWVWGVGFLLAAGLIVVSLSGGWWPSMVIGHGGLFSLYMAFAFGMLQAAPNANWWMAAPGALVLAAGLFLVLTRWRSGNWLRFALSMVTVAVGGWVCAFGLGYDFRTATGLLIAGIGHLGMAVGVVWVRSVAPGRAIQG